MPLRIPAEVVGLEKSIEQQAKRAGRNLKLNLGTNAKSIEGLSQPLGRITGKADQFTKSMEAANARVLAFGASVGVLNTVTQAFKDLVTTTIQVEKQLASINAILGGTDSQLQKFKNTIFDVARNTEQSFATVSEAALELSRQGLTAEEVTRRLNDALILSRLSGQGAAEAVAGLTSAINGFTGESVTSTQVVNKFSEAAKNAAVSERDLAEAFKRAGAVAGQAGVSFDELAGIVSAVQQRTSRGGAVIGNSFKTIFTRLQSIDKLETMQDLGVQVTKANGEILNGTQLIKNLAETIKSLPEAKQLQIAEDLVGKFQVAPFVSILQDFNSEQSIAIKLTQISQNASTAAFERNDALNKTLSASISRTTTSLQELANTLGEIGVTDNLKSLLDFFGNIFEKINDLVGGEGAGSDFAKAFIKGISGVIAGPGLAIFGAIILKLTADLAKFGIGSLKTFFGINRAAKEQASLQGQIASTLLSNKGVQDAILQIERQQISAEQKKVLQTKFFTTALNEQLAVMTKMQSIAARVAPGVLLGTRGRGRGRGAAGGFIPNYNAVMGYAPNFAAESSDIARGVGGAPRSAKPVAIPNFNFGAGQRGTMVANTSEFMVPNFAGTGGTAIFNRDMVSSMGMPAGAKSIGAAGGFIPNFAVGPAGALRGAGITNIQQFRALSGTGATRVIGGVKVTEAQAKNVFARGGGATTPKSTLTIDANQLGGIGLVALFSEAKKRSGFKDLKEGSGNPRKNALFKAGVRQVLVNNIAVSDLQTMRKAQKEKFAAQNRNKIAKLFSQPLGQYGNFILGRTFKNDERTAVSNRIKEIVSGGGSTALFSSAVEGGIFESAIGLVTKGTKRIKDFDSLKDERAPFDFEEGGPADAFFRKIFFGNPDKKIIKADAKRTASADALNSVVGKVINDAVTGPQVRKMAIAQGFDLSKSRSIFAAPRAKGRSSAGGFIPNFAISALDQAVQREASAGLPINQIRINQDPALRNAGNPMGLAVTNTRDEPTGAIPNAAKGFIPNYNILGPDGRPANTTSTRANLPFTPAPRKIKSEIKVVDDSKKGPRDNLGAVFALTAAFSGLTAATSNATSTTGQFVNILAKAGATATTFAFAGQGIQTAFADSTSRVGKFARGLGGALVPLGFIVAGFKSITESVDLFSGVTNAAKDGLAQVADAAKGASRNLSTLSGVGQNRVNLVAEFIAADTLKGVNFEGFDVGGLFKGKLEQSLLEQVKQAIGAGVGMEVINEQIKNITRDDSVTKNEARSFANFLSNQIDDATEFDKSLKDVKNTSGALIERAKRSKGLRGGDDVLLRILRNATKEDMAALRKGESTAFTKDATNELDVLKDFFGAEDGVLKEIVVDRIIKFREQLIAADKAAAQAVEASNAERERINTKDAQSRIKNAINLAKLDKKLLNDKKNNLAKQKIEGGLTQKQIADEEADIKVLEEEIKNRDRILETVEKRVNASKELTSVLSIVAKLENQIKQFSSDGNIEKTERKKLEETVAEILKGNVGEAQRIAKEEQKNVLLSERKLAIAKEQLGVEKLIAAAKITSREEEFILANRLNKDRVLSQIGGDKELLAERAAIRAGITARNLNRPDAFQAIDRQFRDSADAVRLAEIDRDLARNSELVSQSNRVATEFGNILDNLGTLGENVKGKTIIEKVIQDSAGIKSGEDLIDLMLGEGRFSGFSPLSSFLPKNELDPTDIQKAFLDTRDKLVAVFQKETLERKRSTEQITEEAKQRKQNTQLIQGDPDRAFLLKAQARALQAGRVGDLLGSQLSTNPADRLKGLIRDQNFQARFEAMRNNDIETLLDLNEAEQFSGKIIDASQQFAQTIGNAMVDAIAKGKSLSEALMQGASSFFNMISQAFLQEAVNDVVGSSFFKTFTGGISNLRAANSGGMITGGSGVKDDVPALLTGGEFVMRRSAVEKFGPKFMEAINSGNIPMFNTGGMFTPGTFGQGAIRGKSNLLNFATQSFTGGGFDSIGGSGGLGFASLEPQSGRLTMFGRRNSPMFQREQESKREAFGLFARQVQAEKQAKERDKQARRGLLGSIIGAVASIALSGITNKIFNKTPKPNPNQKSILNALPVDGASSVLSVTSGSGASSVLTPPLPVADKRFSPENSNRGLAPGEEFFKNLRLATGGYIAPSAGIDNVPAMLSGGEFVMNAAATQRIGAGNLAAANSGAAGGDDKQAVINRLDQLIAVSSERGETVVNITINSDGSETQDSNAEEKQQNFAKRIKDVVKQTISDEQRLGGTLRRR